MSDRFFVCRCYFTNNYYLKKPNIHVCYLNDEQFMLEYRSVLHGLGFGSDEQLQELIVEIKQEKTRRENVGHEMQRRKNIIQEKYERCHPDIYTLQKKFLDPKFLELVEFCRSDERTVEEVRSCLKKELASEVYTFPVFTEEFCTKFMEEISHFEASDCPKGRPNTMNKYGVLLNELGFDDQFLIPLREKYLHHITKSLYPEWGGHCLDSHKAFVVKYKQNEDLDLSYHFDNAEVTINVNIGRKFEGGQLYFGDMRNVSLEDTECTQVDHIQGTGLLHRGQHKHGAMKIHSGERYNLIIWMRSSSVRNRLCPMCDQPPVLVPSEGYGDGFQQRTVDICIIE